MKLDLWEENNVYELVQEKIITLKKQIKEEEELIRIYRRYDTGSIQQKSSRKKAYYQHLDNKNNLIKKYFNYKKLSVKFTNRDR